MFSQNNDEFSEDIGCYGYGFFDRKNDVPLLQMHQLISFIEEKSGSSIDIGSKGYYRYLLTIFYNEENNKCSILESKSGYLLDALLKLSIEIAKKQITQD